MFNFSLAAFFTYGALLRSDSIMSDEAKKSFKEKMNRHCNHNPAFHYPSEYLDMEVEMIVWCFKDHLNINAIDKDIEDADTKEDLNDVMFEHCRSAGGLDQCLLKVGDRMEYCHRESLEKRVRRYIKSIAFTISFWCRDVPGSTTRRITEFISDGGYDCYKDKKSEFKECYNKMKSNPFWTQCDNYDEFSDCAVKVMKTCTKEIAPKLTEQYFRELREDSECSNQPRTESNTANTEPQHSEDDKTTCTCVKVTNLLRNGSTSTDATTSTASSSQTTTNETTTNGTTRKTTTKSTTTGTPLPKDGRVKYMISNKKKMNWRAMMKIYCIENGGDERDANELEHAMINCISCAKKHINFQKIKREVQMARPFGRKMMKKVFGKYCEKSWNLKECIFAMTKKAVGCATDRTQLHVEDWDSVFGTSIDFSCWNGAERLAIYYTNDGPDCVLSKFEAILDCAVVKNGLFWEDCANFDNFMKCVVELLKGCTRMIISQLAQKLFADMWRSSPCGRD